MNVTPYLYIIAGPLKGSKIRLRPSLTLGRKKANINLKDSKVSSLHAQISRDTEGQWCIEDMGSRNGIYQNGIRYKKVILKEKKPIFIGDNLFVLKYKPTKKEDHNKREAKGEKSLQVPQQAPWEKRLLKFCNDLRLNAKNIPCSIHPFHPAIMLSIISGIQAETQWYIGYGPRVLGARSLDFKLFEPNLPDYSFKLSSKKQKAVFKTEQPHIVKLNGYSISSASLSHGDIISISETRIQVSFLSV